MSLNDDHTNLDFVSRKLLSGIAWMDRHHGAQSWNLHYVAAVTAGVLFAIRLVLKKRRGVDWYALVHAIVSGFGSLAVAYLNFSCAEKMTGVTEPLRSVQCQGPLTSLHRILPAITMGYAVFDLLDGLTLGVDFLIHGAATLAMMAFFVEQGIPQIMAPYLVMEVSTIFLTMVRADFFTPTTTMINQALFVLNFFAFRIVLVPIMWLQLVWTLYTQQYGMEASESCIPGSVLPSTVIGGVLFHLLNLFWFYKIVKKVQRKLSGKEHIQANNDLKESSTPSSSDDLPPLKLADSDLDQPESPLAKKEK